MNMCSLIFVTPSIRIYIYVANNPYFYVDLHSHDVCIVVVVSSAASSLGSANSSDSIAGWQLGQVDFDFQRNVLACATWSNDNQSCLALVLQHHYSVLQSLVS